MYKKFFFSTLTLCGALSQCAIANTLQSAHGWYNSPSFQLLLRFKDKPLYMQTMYYATNTLELQFEEMTFDKNSEKSLINALNTLQNTGFITEHYFEEEENTCTLGITFATTRNAAKNRLLVGMRTENNTLILDLLPNDFLGSTENHTQPATTKQTNASWRIMIDPGHGGKDPGAIAADQTYEKTLALDIAQQVANILKTKNFTPIMTRSDDTFVSLANRSELALCNNADIFVSIHLNASSWSTPLSNGIESYSLRNPTRLPSGLMRDYTFINQKEDPLLTQAAEKALLTTIKNSQQLTTFIQQNICSTTTTTSYIPKNRGAKTETFRVLLLNRMPSTLVEAGFISNDDELTVLQQPEHRKHIAEGIVQGIEQYISEQTRKKTVADDE